MLRQTDFLRKLAESYGKPVLSGVAGPKIEGEGEECFKKAMTSSRRSTTGLPKVLRPRTIKMPQHSWRRPLARPPLRLGAH